jgi:hypothetical protein
LNHSNSMRRRDRQPGIRLPLGFLQSRDKHTARLERSHLVGHRQPCVLDHG